MATDYQAIMLALTRGDSWTTITHDFGCSRRTIDKASRTIRTHGFDTTAILSLSPGQLTELFPDNCYRKEEDFLPPNFTAIAARQRRDERVSISLILAGAHPSFLATWVCESPFFERRALNSSLRNPLDCLTGRPRHST